MKSNSYIFDDAEMRAMTKRLKGEFSDSTGAFSRARKKLEEIKAWNTPTMRKRMQKLLQPRRKVRVEEQAKPNDEQSFEEFKQGVGY